MRTRPRTAEHQRRRQAHHGGRRPIRGQRLAKVSETGEYVDGDGRGEHASTVSRGGRGVKGGGGGWVVDFNRMATGAVGYTVVGE